MSIIDGLLSHFAELGLGGVLALVRHRLTKRNKRIRVQVPGIKHPVTLRLRTSDHQVFRDIFLNHEYLFNPPSPPKTIVDAGANIGLSTVYFANRWPDAWIIAIEPDPGNFEILLENVRAYPRIIALQAAVWHKTERLDIFNPAGEAWAAQTKVSADGSVQGFTIPDIMNIHGLPRIDFLKMDIEGAEREVFEHHAEWIDRIGSIVVETHDRFAPGSHTRVMSAANHFKDIYGNGVTTWFMLREKTARPVAPKIMRGVVVRGSAPSGSD